MASIAKANAANVPGGLFVDTTCIDCGTCYHLAPQIFDEGPDDLSFVKLQPSTLEDWGGAKRAMISCPTNSIGVKEVPSLFKEADGELPVLVADHVFYCGYTSRDSFGASSYLIQRAEGNILVDSPRWNLKLAQKIEELGGIKTMILTHKDDVADHGEWAKRFGCERLMHADDLTTDTKEIERPLRFSTPLKLAEDLLLLPVPGHTKGHIVLLYENKFIFTGDHAFFDKTSGTLTASRNVCWYSWSQQVASMKSLLSYSFEWIMPGHGGWGHLDQGKMRSELERLVKQMENTP